FVEAPVDVSALPSKTAPILSEVSDGRARQATENDLLFMKSGSGVFEVSVGPHVTVRPSAYSSPDERRFVLKALTIDGGLWWAAGHDSNDPLIGMLYFSEDGASW